MLAVRFPARSYSDVSTASSRVPLAVVVLMLLPRVS
jgi:hypothetical protein